MVLCKQLGILLLGTSVFHYKKMMITISTDFCPVLTLWVDNRRFCKYLENHENVDFS